MENYIKDISDITYMSELILDIFKKRKDVGKCQGLNSQTLITVKGGSYNLRLRLRRIP